MQKTSGKIQEPLSEEYLYHFPWPYELKQFEKELAMLEVEGVTCQSPEMAEDGLLLATQSELPYEKIARVSSFHKVFVEHDGVIEDLWTLQGILERSATIVRETRSFVEIDKSLQQIQQVPLQKREKQYSLHELHSYKGKYYPQLVRPLITGWLQPGQRLLDPFCGSGTTLIEAHFSGVKSVGVDLNPIGYFISKARVSCMRADLNKLTKYYIKFQKISKKKAIIQTL